MILGLIGGAGSGKSMVLAYLERECGIETLRLDELAKELYHPGTEVFEALVRIFGEEILSSDRKGIDSTALSRKIYGDAALRRRLEEVVHPAVWAEAGKRIRSARERGQTLAVETALPTAEFAADCDEVWYIYVQAPERIRRLMETRGYSRERAEAVLRAQPEESLYQSLSDHRIDNTNSKEETLHEIYEHCERLKRECKLYRNGAHAHSGGRGRHHEGDQ